MLGHDGYRELGSQINPNATRSLGLEAPLTKQQILNTPVNVLKTQGANANPVTMAGGGMGEAGMGMPPMMGGAPPMGMPPMAPPPTDFAMLLETLLMPKNKMGRKPPLRPVGATMGVAA
jgi:hypothetical protein